MLDRRSIFLAAAVLSASPLIAAAMSPTVAVGQSRLPSCPNDRGVLRRNCQGAEIYPDGSKYVGEFKDGKEDGRGILTYPDGSRYVGEFKDDMKNGQGIYTAPNGAEFVGEFKDGKVNIQH
jgi:hypothetical protein